MYSSFGRTNSSQANLDLICAVHAHKRRWENLSSATFLTANTFLKKIFFKDSVHWRCGSFMWCLYPSHLGGKGWHLRGSVKTKEMKSDRCNDVQSAVDLWFLQRRTMELFSLFSMHYSPASSQWASGICDELQQYFAVSALLWGTPLCPIFQSESVYGTDSMQDLGQHLSTQRADLRPVFIFNIKICFWNPAHSAISSPILCLSLA